MRSFGCSWFSHCQCPLFVLCSDSLGNMFELPPSEACCPAATMRSRYRGDPLQILPVQHTDLDSTQKISNTGFFPLWYCSALWKGVNNHDSQLVDAVLRWENCQSPRIEADNGTTTTGGSCPPLGGQLKTRGRSSWGWGWEINFLLIPSSLRSVEWSW